MADVSNTITVEWQKNEKGGGVKGRIIRDPKGRKKIVFVHDMFRGRRPRAGETTEARVVGESKRGDKQSGVLFVNPIYPVAPNALTDKDAMAELLKLAKAASPVFGPTDIPVNLPGWKGRLEGDLDTRKTMSTWVFCHEETGDRYTIWDDGMGGIALTHAIRKGGLAGGLSIVDYNQACKDLGKPASMEPTAWGSCRITWRDKRMNKFQADIDRETAQKLPFTVTNLKLSENSRHVLGDVALLEGAWPHPERRILEGEFTDLKNRDQLTYAKFVDELEHGLTDDVKRAAAALIRPHLHSAAWYHQMRLREFIDDNWSQGSITRVIDEVATALAQRETRYLYNLQQFLDFAHKQLIELHDHKPSFVGEPDPIIYEGYQPSDQDAVAALTARNEEDYQRLKARCEELLKQF